MTKPTLVIVDDIQLSRERLTQQLSADFEVLAQAECGRSAIHLCQTLHPQLVLMDVCMPDMSGIEAMREIFRTLQPGLESPEVVKPSVILLSGITDEKIAAQALEAGAAEYLLKPIETEKLKSVLRIFA